MKPIWQAVLSVLFGLFLACVLALGVWCAFPPEPEPITIWNWDKWTRFHR